MTRLHIAFQEGFEGDEVVLELEGTRVYRNENLRTRLQIGLAANVDLDVEPGTRDVEILLPKKGLAEKLSVRVENRSYLGISLEAAEIRWFISEEPFRYA